MKISAHFFGVLATVCLIVVIHAAPNPISWIQYAVGAIGFFVFIVWAIILDQKKTNRHSG